MESMTARVKEEPNYSFYGSADVSGNNQQSLSNYVRIMGDNLDSMMDFRDEAEFNFFDKTEEKNDIVGIVQPHHLSYSNDNSSFGMSDLNVVKIEESVDYHAFNSDTSNYNPNNYAYSTTANVQLPLQQSIVVVRSQSQQQPQHLVQQQQSNQAQPMHQHQQQHQQQQQQQQIVQHIGAPPTVYQQSAALPVAVNNNGHNIIYQVHQQPAVIQVTSTHHQHQHDTDDGDILMAAPSTDGNLLQRREVRLENFDTAFKLHQPNAPSAVMHVSTIADADLQADCVATTSRNATATPTVTTTAMIGQPYGSNGINIQHLTVHNHHYAVGQARAAQQQQQQQQQQHQQHFQQSRPMTTYNYATDPTNTALHATQQPPNGVPMTTTATPTTTPTTDNRLYECPICQRQFTLLQHLRVHMHTHDPSTSGTNNTGDIEMLSAVTVVDNHGSVAPAAPVMLTSNGTSTSPSNVFSCDLCGIVFEFGHELDAHTATSHTIQSLDNCDPIMVAEAVVIKSEQMSPHHQQQQQQQLHQQQPQQQQHHLHHQPTTAQQLTADAITSNATISYTNGTATTLSDGTVSPPMTVYLTTHADGIIGIAQQTPPDSPKLIVAGTMQPTSSAATSSAAATSSSPALSISFSSVSASPPLDMPASVASPATSTTSTIGVATTTTVARKSTSNANKARRASAATTNTASNTGSTSSSSTVTTGTPGAEATAADATTDATRAAAAAANRPSLLCSFCGQAYRKKRNLDNHMLTAHTNKQLFQCEKCPKLFDMRSSMKIHMNSHNQNKPHKCTECDKSYTQLPALKNHMLTHSKSAQWFDCDTCGKSFNQLSSLKSHKQAHSGIRPHKCTVCNKAYTQSSSLKVHMNIHTGTKPYKCDVCEKTFSDPSNFRKHKATTHGDQSRAK